jgi:uncharacterized membrane protein YdjX (TVP38/TMEM64 family)
MSHRVYFFLRRHAGLLKGGALLLTVLALVLLVRVLPFARSLEVLREESADLGAWGLILLGLFYVLSTVVLLPSWPTTLAAGALFGPGLGTVLISAASTVSAAISFGLGRFLAHSWVARRVVHYPRVHAVYRALGQQGNWKIVAAVRLGHMGPYGLQSFLFGLTPIRFGLYLFTTWLVMLPGTVVYVYLGRLGAVALESAGSGAPPAGLATRLAEAVSLLVALGALAYVANVARWTIQTASRHGPPHEAPAGR